jgi:uncharacterized protein (DUF362 family)/NAD-dependent dihydropyrimidine dehydrogenase PreA subunit
MVFQAVEQSVNRLGGIRHYVQPDQRVLLKVNLVNAAEPERAISTHPAVVKAVIRLVQQAGGIPIIGDSPSGFFNRNWLRDIYEKTGMLHLAEETGALLNWNCGYSLVLHPQGRQAKAIEIGNYVTEADVIFSLSKLKTHNWMGFTGATKILFGTIPGFIKMGYHAKFPSPERFGDMLIDIVTLVRPALAFMDGITGMDGNGPADGDPFQVGAILVSPDSVALDIVACALVGIQPAEVYPLQAAIQRGLSSGRLEDITVLGNPLSDFVVSYFRRAASPNTLAGRITELGKDVLKAFVKNALVAAPQFNTRFSGNAHCDEICPEKAISFNEKRANINLAHCNRCYACYLNCPASIIELRTPIIGRLLGYSQPEIAQRDHPPQLVESGD